MRHTPRNASRPLPETFSSPPVRRGKALTSPATVSPYLSSHAHPNALTEKEREKYSSLHDFIRAVVVPEMQIKLKQGFGRAIRTESDTCVVAILDERACPGQRYHQDVKATLPKIPATSSICDVAEFIYRVKSAHYFQEGLK